MDKDDFIVYILACGGGTGSATPDRMAKIFNENGDALQKDRIFLRGFFLFYRTACVVSGSSRVRSFHLF